MTIPAYTGFPLELENLKNRKGFYSQGILNRLEKLGKITQNTAKFRQFQTNIICYFGVIFKWTVYYLLKLIKFSVKKQNIKKNTGKMKKITVSCSIQWGGVCPSPLDADPRMQTFALPPNAYPPWCRPPPSCGQTNTCENIILQTSFAGGKNSWKVGEFCQSEKKWEPS